MSAPETSSNSGDDARDNAGESSGDNAPGPAADFGFRDVPEGEKAPLVRAVFDSVAGRYDLMNDLMCAGIHRWWKAEMVRVLNPRPGHIAIKRSPVIDERGNESAEAFPKSILARPACEMCALR